MGPKRGHLTTALPRQLREELGLPDRYAGKRRRQQQKQSLSRKERRKQERDLRKKKQKQRQFQRAPSSDEEDVSDDELEGFDGDEEEEEIPEDAATSSDESDEQDEPKEKKSSSKSRKIPKHVQEQLAQDDAEIAMLEKKLGIKGRKKLPKIFEEEGLAELLGDLGADSEEEETRKRKREDNEWLQRKRRKAQGTASEDEESEEDDMFEDEDELDDLDGIEEDEGDEDLEDDEIIEGDEDDEDGVDDEDEEDGEEDEDEDEDFSGFDDEDDEEDDEEDSRKEQPKKRENPYVAPVSSSNRPKYVPPSLRAPDPDSEEQVRLRRQAQGALNKLSESNLISILGEVEKLYREYPRQNVTSTLATLLLNLVMDRVSLQDTFVILHAGFIAAIYKVIGMDFGAEIVQRLVESFDKIAADEQAKEGKQNLNLMSLLSQLYNFHVVGSNLVFDYIRLFLQEINETNTELLLKIIRSTYFWMKHFFFLIPMLTFCRLWPSTPSGRPICSQRHRAPDPTCRRSRWRRRAVRANKIYDRNHHGPEEQPPQDGHRRIWPSGRTYRQDAQDPGVTQQSVNSPSYGTATCLARGYSQCGQAGQMVACRGELARRPARSGAPGTCQRSFRSTIKDR